MFLTSTILGEIKEENFFESHLLDELVHDPNIKIVGQENI